MGIKTVQILGFSKAPGIIKVNFLLENAKRRGAHSSCASAPRLPLGLREEPAAPEKLALLCWCEHFPLCAALAPFCLFLSWHKKLWGHHLLLETRQVLAGDKWMATHWNAAAWLRDGWALIKGLLCLQEDREINVKTAVLRLLFHRVEANYDAFNLRGWRVWLPGATQVPPVVMASEPGAQGARSLLLYLLTVPHLSPLVLCYRRQKKREKFCLVNWSIYKEATFPISSLAAHDPLQSWGWYLEMINQSF